MKRLKNLVNQIVPPHTPLHNLLKNTLSTIGVTRVEVFTGAQYRAWIKENETAADVLKNPSVNNSIKVSIVTCFWNTQDRYLDELIDSLNSQTQKSGWELVIVDVSSKEDRSARIKEAADLNDNFVYLKMKNVDIATNTNFGISSANGEYIAFVDHDDTLAPNALEEIITVINSETPSVIYSDEDKIDDKGRVRHSPYFKPDWSPHLLLYTNYLNHLTVIKKVHIDAVGGLRAEYNGSQDYDLLLRVSHNMDSKKVIHIPKVLYHWREAVGSTAQNQGNKSYAFDAGKRAIEDYLGSLNIDAKVSHVAGSPGFYEETFKAPKGTKVKIITKYEDSLRDNTSSNLDILFDDRMDEESDYIVHINENIVPVDKSWLDKLVGVIDTFINIETVSPRVLSKDGSSIIHAGNAVVEALVGFDDYSHLAEDQHTPVGSVRAVRDISEPLRAIYVTRGERKKLPTAKYNVLWSHVNFLIKD